MSPSEELRLRVERIEEVTPEIRGITLGAASGLPLAPYVAGSHIVLDCGGRRNAYSLTGSGRLPETYAISVLIRPGGQGGSRFLHGVSPGDVLCCSAPRSAFAPVATARHHLMVAGGIGITPFLSHLRAARLWNRTATLVFGAGASGPVPHEDELRALTDGDLRLARNRVDLRSLVEEALRTQPLGTHLYVCGPAGLIEATLAMARDLGWPEERCHAERFGAAELEDGSPFELRLERSDLSVGIASGTSLLDALAHVGIEWPAMCRRGVCGECRMGGAKGRILHRDFVLTAAERAEGTCLMPCVSRAEGVLTLEL